MAQLDVLPDTLTGTLIVGDGRTWTATSSTDWPASTRLRIVNAAGTETVLTPVIATTLATWTVTVAEAAALRGTKTSGSLDARITTDTGDALRPWASGRISIVGAYVGSSVAQSLAVVVMGPEGPSAVSADAGNAAELGTDGLIFVSPTAGSTHIIQDEGVALTSRAALNFAGAGVTVTDDPGNGAILVTIPSGGATTLDALTDVATAGQSAGRALVSDGTNWAPSSAAVILEGDTRLTDARTPTDNSVTNAKVGAGAAIDLDKTVDSATRLALTVAERTKLSNTSGTNSGDQTLPTWSTISGKPAVVAAGVDAAAARSAIGAGTSSFSGAYTDLTGKPTLGDAAAKNTGTTAGTVAAGDHNHSGVYAPASHNHAASDIASGTVATARLGSGTADSTTMLGGDQVYRSPHAVAQSINAQTGTTYTLVAGDVGKLVTCSNAAAITVTLPQDSDATFAVGSRVDVAVLGAGMVTFVAGTGATANGTPSLVTRAQYSGVTCYKRAANTWLVIGDLA